MTLDEFEVFWNRLHEGVTLHLPHFIGKPSCRVVKPDPLDMDYSNVDLTCDVTQSERPIRRDAIGGEISTKLIMELPYEGYEGLTLISEPFSADFRVALGIPTEELKVDESSMKLFFRDWKTGKYETAFPKLARLSRGLSTADIKTVPERLKDMQGSNEEAVEIFGLRIRRDEVAGWGVMILCCFQFYFWLHLHELSKKIRPDDEGWDVAWIGVYRSMIAAVVSLLSACALPVVAVGLLASRLLFTSQLLASGRYLAFGAVLLGIAASAFLSATTARRFLKLRQGSAT